MSENLPKVLQTAIAQAGTLGSATAALTEVALRRLWFDAATPLENGGMFLSTGDIDAMWIRDSAWQARPLLRFISDEQVDEFVRRIIKTQSFYLSIDPYANAFNPLPNGHCWHKDFPEQSPWVFERKFELDSITAFWQLSLDYADSLKSDSCLDEEWWKTTESLVSVLWKETKHDSESYFLHRPQNPPHDSLSNFGKGSDFADCGLIWSGFRPSDDACELPFHVPSNAHAQIVLERLAELAEQTRPELAESCRELAKQIREALDRFAWLEVDGIRTLAYEVDGKGGSVLMDDANYPNLLSLKFLGFADGAKVVAARKFSLSAANPWFFTSEKFSGLGSPHTGNEMIWPLALAMTGITADSQTEMLSQLRMIEDAASGNAIHESFSVENPQKYTREWFSWAEMTYFELVMRILES